ncbi:MAG: aminotransferase class I/II-fold pyridoxal phosphate-dependent enzyme [Gemmatimonadales bacterium]|nr:aminotransferase class I/II-fold pyridoxal phosphate-dependent enzyme [Gemmatimonadales bacterium]NIN12993.1 aminotransferase class I/II-fold pyridoxal phosphate-dependent enzyme [Gemmatimonadales bacterium]NIN51070.1 aminotransferase class I/II-fold pyridoxal phosphate-dependent enzyme [Gemmatimonadales bacterium]NIP08534.1 aminotransferase class I/II-fold pyridoxal phosphate-dependent enzyme [Gemmatimonadales bacterium]NIR02252.1 aminotransferase class I/II-fold pyridoxal phosphate-depende
MQRRAFLQTGLAAGVMGMGGVTAAPHLLKLSPRTGLKGPIRLSSNENPLGIAPAARRAIIEGLVDANRYPQGSGRMIEALAAKHGVKPENIVLGAGSTEVLKMTVHALATPSGRLIVAEPTYEDGPWYAGALPVEVVKVPLRSDYSHDLDQMQARASAGTGTVLVYLCSPNNPTGTLTPSADIDAWIASAPDTMYFLVDEAYFDYVEDPRYWSAIRWVPERPNVVIARTFSKVYGMAGIRLGYGIAHEETAERLRRFRVRNNANHLALVAGMASLDEAGFVERSLDVNQRGKRILHECLEDLGLDYLPSHTNFVMHRITGDLKTYREMMLERGIRVGRPFPPMLTHSRLSIGLPAEMEQFAETLKALRKEGKV